MIRLLSIHTPPNAQRADEAGRYGSVEAYFEEKAIPMRRLSMRTRLSAPRWRSPGPQATFWSPRPNRSGLSLRARCRGLGRPRAGIPGRYRRGAGHDPDAAPRRGLIAGRFEWLDEKRRQVLVGPAAPVMLADCRKSWPARTSADTDSLSQADRQNPKLRFASWRSTE